MSGMKYLVLVAFVAIIGSLAAALVFMMRSSGNDASASDDSDVRQKRMARALALRVGFSILLFLIVLGSYLMGWIQPTGLPVRP
jgi:hypothetical protein